MKIEKLFSAILLSLFAAACSAGGLTPGGSTFTGDAVGTIAQVQPAGTNLLPGTSAIANAWIGNGAVTKTDNLADRWDGGFIPTTLSGASSADFVNRAAISITPPSTVSYTFSGQFSVASGLTGITTASTQVAVAIAWTGLSRTDTLIFNPANGQIVSASAGIATASMQVFNTTIFNATTGQNTTIPVLNVTFTSSAITTAATAFTLAVTPQNLSGSAQVSTGGWQVELGPVATAFMPTANTAGATQSADAPPTPFRTLGTIPRQTITFDSPVIQTAINTFKIDPLVHSGFVINESGVNKAVQLPGSSSVVPPQNGMTVTVFVRAATRATISVNGAEAITGANLPSGTTSFNFPLNAGITSDDSALTFVYSAVGTEWLIVNGNQGALTAATAFPVAPTISSGFGTSPSIAGLGTTSFRLNVGTGGVATSGVIGLSTVGTAWDCQVQPFNPGAAQLLNTTVVSASNTSTVTLSNLVTSSGAAAAWTASQVLILNCAAR